MPSHNASIPYTYADLSKTDISLLAPIFTPPPTSTTSSASASYKEVTRQLIAELPQHLRSKMPLMNTFCHGLHAKLNPFPVQSLLGVVRDEIAAADEWDGEVQRTLRGVRMEEMKCKACQLASVGRDIRTLVVLGAVIVAKLGHRKWKQSKRVRWMEEWIRACAESRVEGDAKVREMWNLGLRLRRVRRGDDFSEASSLAETERRTALEIVRMVPVRPERSAEQEDHVAVANDILQRRRGLRDPFEEEVEAGELLKVEEQQQQPILMPEDVPEMGNPFADPEYDINQLFPTDLPADRTLPQAYSHASMVPQPLAVPSTEPSRATASSVYSSDDEEEQPWETARSIPTIESQIFDLYRYSRGPGEGS